MAWHLIVAVANPVASFRADRQPIADPRPAPGFVCPDLSCFLPGQDLQASTTCQSSLASFSSGVASFPPIVRRESRRPLATRESSETRIFVVGDGREVHVPGAVDHRGRRGVFRWTAR